MRRDQASKRGVAAVEFALLISLVLVPIMAGVWDISKFIDIDHVLTRAAREAAVLASRGQDPEATVRDYVDSEGLIASNLDVSVSEADIGDDLGTEVKVELSYDFSGYTIFPWEKFMPRGVVVDASAKKE